ncbi:hypothetical protein [Ileibacterium valens]|uniref:hypothetical protein n=1 Tax=Ileibacterium valens TaxID=1862668 RepID=UPI00272F948B|nr:hypothetical protein [Ileibacterium valens]
MKTLSKQLQTFFADKGCEFDSFRQLMMDTYSKELDGVSVKEANDKIRQIMFSLLELDEKDVRNPKLFRRSLSKHKAELFEVIEDVIEERQLSGWGSDPFFMDFVETKNLAYGDVNEFYAEKECLLTAYRVAGDHHDYVLQRLGYGESFSVKTATYGIAVGADIKSFLTGNTDWTALIDALYKAMDRKVKDIVYAELSAIGDKLPISTQFNKAMALSETTKPQVDELIEMVRGANDDAEVVVVGTPAAVRKLSALTDIKWVSGDMKNEKYQTGKLGFYEGNPLMEIPQRFEKVAGKLVPMIENNKLYILPKASEKFIKFVNVGDPEILEITDKGARIDDTMKFEYQQSFGAASVVTQYMGLIEIQ